MSQVFRVAWYRFRATFGRQWGGYLSIVVLIGLLGGLAMGAVAGAAADSVCLPDLPLRFAGFGPRGDGLPPRGQRPSP